MAAARHSYAVSTEGRGFLQLPESFSAGQASVVSYSVETAVAYGLNDSSHLAGSPLF